MDEVKTLHHNLYKAVESHNTETSLSIIDDLLTLKQSCHEVTEGCLDRYSHRDCFPLTPLIHSITKQNADVALHLLENGCDPSVDSKLSDQSKTKHKTPSKSKYDFMFKIIGKPSFEPVLMKVLEATGSFISDSNRCTVLHAICKMRSTLWLKMILDSSSQHGLFSRVNKDGYLPMHVAAECNFLDYFDFVYNYNDKKPIVHDVSDDTKTAPVFEKDIMNVDENSTKISSEANSVSFRPIEVGELPTPTEDVGDDRSLLQNKSVENRIQSDCDVEKDTNKTCTEKDLIVCNGNKEPVVNCLDIIPTKIDIDINTSIGGTGVTALHIASRFKYYQLVKLLVEIGADVNQTDRRHHSPLFACFQSVTTSLTPEWNYGDFVDVCRVLIGAGAGVNGYYRLYHNIGSTHGDDYLVTPLHVAAQLGHQDIVQLLLNNGADPKATSQILGKLPVQFALEFRQMECARILLDSAPYPKGFLASFLDTWSNSLLHSAGDCDERIVTELVMNFESCLDRPNLNLVFPLDMAVYYQNVPYIRAILSRRPDLINKGQHQEFKTCPPLHRAASSSIPTHPLCQILLSYGANIYAKAYGKNNMPYRRALRSDCYRNAVYLCELMSRPFTLAEREELLDYSQNRMTKELSGRVIRRLENVPSLLMHCLDAIRQVVITNCQSFESIDSLPVPHSMIRTLKYEYAEQC